MCDCFHLVLPNWQGSPASDSGIQLRPEEPEADADAEEDDSVNEVTIENIRPRPQGSSPVYEYSIEEEYLKKKLQEDTENEKYSTDKQKMSHSQESMEVTLKTEVESGASGFSVTGGGNEGIFVKQVLKGSPASKLFNLREGDQLLSATIFFDNIKYEDALKILQYSEPYKLQFSLKRKLAGKEELEKTHSTAQHKKEKLSQEKELNEKMPGTTLEMSEKIISEDKEKEIVKQRVGRTKRPKKERLSWPKLQSIKNKKILGHRRSHSTSDASEHAIQDISPTNTDTESQLQQEEFYAIEKKGSQKKLKFPNIGFKMHRTKPETEEKQKSEIKTVLPTKRDDIPKEDISIETPDILTVEYSTSTAYETKAGEMQQNVKKDLRDMKNGLPIQTKRYPEVEISIKKQKEQLPKFQPATTKPEEPLVTKPTSEIYTAGLKEAQTKKLQQVLPRTRKKKQKGSSEKKSTKIALQHPGEDLTNIEIRDQLEHGYVQIKGLEITTTNEEIKKQKQETKTKEEHEQNQNQISDIHREKFGISITKLKGQESEITFNVLETDIPKTTVRIEETEIDLEAPKVPLNIDIPDAEKQVSDWKMQTPSLKMPKMPKADVQAPKVDISLPSVEVTLPKAQVDIQGPETTTQVVKIEGEIKATEKEAKEKESKFKMPKFGFPPFGWSTTKETSGGVAEVEASLKEPQVTTPSVRAEGGITVSGPEIQAPSVELEIGTSAGKDGEKGKIKMPDVKLPSVKLPKVKAPQVQVSLPKVEGDIALPKSAAEIKEGGFEVKSPDIESGIEVETGKAEATGMKIHTTKVKMPSMRFSKPEIKAHKIDVDVSLPKVDVTLPTCDVSLQEADLKAPAVVGGVSISAPGVKIPTTEGSIQLKSPAIDAVAPSAEIAVEGTEGKAAGLEGKIKMPKFEKPKFGVTLPKGKVPEGEISLPKMEAHIPKPQVEAQVATIDLKTPKLEVEVEVPEAETKVSGWKMQMPSVKMPKMPKADIQAPKVDISLPSVDVTLPKAQVEIQDPKTTAQVVKIEGEVKATEKDAKEKESKFKMPKFGFPSFGWSTTKETSGGEAEVKGSLKEPQVTVPSVKAEGGITVSGPEIQAPSVELEIGSSAGKDGEKGKIKMPDVKLPSVKLPKVKAPQVQVSLPKVEGDIALPKSAAEIKEGGFEVKSPDMESGIEVETGKAEATGMKIHMPKVKMPSMRFSKPEIKAHKIDVDVSLPKVDVTIPTCDVSLQEADLKAPAVVGGVSISAPGVKIPTTEGSIQLKSPAIDAVAPSAEIAVEGTEGKAAGLEGKIKMPKFEKPKFGVTLPKGKVPEGEISLPKMEAHIPKPQVEAQVATIDLKTPKLEVEVEVPEAETKVSGWKMQMPSVKMPKMPKADIQAPKVDISLPSVDVTLPKAQVEIQDPKTTAQVVKIEGEVKATEKDAKEKESKFKMPKFGFPSFGWSTTKETSGGETEVKGSLKEPQVTVPSVKAEGGITVSGPEIQAPSVELEIGSSAGKDGEKGKIKMPDVKLPSVKLPKVKAPQVQVSLPKVEGDIALPKSAAEIKEGGFEVKSPDMESGIEVETGKAEATGMKIHMPKVKMPSMRFSKPEIKAHKIDVDVSLPKVDVTIPTCDVSLQEADLKAPAVVGGVSISAPGVKIPTTEGSIQLKSPAIDVVAPSAEIAVEGTEGKAAGLEGKIKMPKFEKPKFAVTLPKGKVPEGEISLPKMEAHIPKPQVEAQVATIDLKTPKLEVEVEVPEAETKVSGWKMQMPSVKMPKMPKADIQAPKVDISLPSVDVTLPKAQVEIQDPKTTAQVVKIEGEVKATEKDAKEKESKFKMPKFGFPSFGWSTTKETSGGEAEVKGSLKEPQVTVPSVKAEGGITVSGPEIQAPSVELEIGSSAGKDGEKGKIKMPDVKLPSVKLPKVKAPQVQVSLPKVEGDIALPKSAAEIKEGGFEVKSPDVESGIEVETGKAEATGMKIHMPKVKMPSMRFSKPEIKAHKIDVDVSLPKVDVTIPTCDVSLQEADLKAPAVVGGVSISAPGVKIPTTEGSIQLKSPAIDVVAPSAEIAVEGTEGKAAGLEGKIKMPKFEKPKFGVTLPKGKVPEGEISLPKMEAHIPKPQVEAQVATIDLKTPKLEVEVEVPEAETKVSGWKMQMPSVKMPKMPKADIQAPKVDISLTSVDVTLPKAQVEIQDPKTTAQVVKIEGEVKATEKDAKEKESKFKMPKFGFPSFGWSTTKETSGGEAEVKASLKEPQVTMPSVKAEGGITVSGPEIQSPSVEFEIGSSAGKDGEKGKIKMPDVKLPSVKLPKVKAPQVQVSLPKVEGDIALPKSAAEIKEGGFEVKSPDMESGIEVETGKAEATGMKIHMPKVKMPSMRFSKPEIKAHKIDVDVSLPKVDVTIPTCDVSLQEADLKAPAVVGGVSISAPGVKIPTTEGFIQLKSPGIETIAPSVGIAVEGTEGKAAGLEGKIKMPKFEKPKFEVTLPKGKVPEGEISLSTMEARISKPQVEAQVATIDLKTPKLEVGVEVPEAETKVSGWKMQMPSVKMHKMPKDDIYAPKVDISLPSVDITLPKAQVEIQGPETTAQVVKLEGEIKATEKVAKERESKFKMPKFGIPSFGWSTTKETSGGVAEVEVSLKEPQVTTPSVRAEEGITVSGPEIQAPNVELEIGTSAGKDSEKGKIKMPDVKLPSVKLPKVKAPQVQVSLPKVEGDIALPKFAAEIKEGGFEVKSPDMESGIEVETGKAEATGMKIHMPKVKMPSMRFSKPEMKAPKIDVDVSLPKVDVTHPTCDVSLQEAELKAPAVVGAVSISAPGVKIPTTEGSIQMKSPGIEAIAPSAGIAVEGAEGKATSLEGKIKMPKFEKPKFGVTLPKCKVPEGEVSLPKMEAHIPKPQVEAQVSAIDLKTPKLEVEIDVPEAEIKVSGWKMEMPSVKMPKMPKADIQAPKVDISLPSVDVTLPKAQVEIQASETTAQVIKIESEIKATEKDAKEKESLFSMPKIGIPSFGWSTTKETRGGVAEVDANLKEPQVTTPSVRAEGVMTVSGPEIQAPSVELEIGTSAGKDGEKGKIKMTDVKLPSVKLPKVKAPQVQVSLPKVEGDIALPKAEIKEGGFEVKSPDMESGIEVETGKAEATGMKIHMPKVKMPSMRFSKSEIKAPKIDVDVSSPKVDIRLPTSDVSLQEADLKAPAVVGGVSISAPGVKIPTTEGSIQLKSPGTEAIAPSAGIAVEGTEGKAAGLEGKIKMPKFEKPKFGVTLPKGKVPEGEVSLPKMEAHIPKPQVETQVAAIDLKTPKLEVEIDVPEAETQVSGWKMQMPSVKMPKMPKADIQAPKVDISLPSVDVTLPKAQVEIQGPETTAQVVKIEGEIKATEKVAKEKESMFSMPKFGIPSFGWSTTKETRGGVAEVDANLKEPQVTTPSVRAEGVMTVSGPEFQAPSVELEIGTSAGKDGEKGKIKMPDVKLPSTQLPKVKAPQVQVSLPKVQGDIALPKSAAEIKEGGFEVKSPDMESVIEVEKGKAEATGMKIHMPKVKIPSMRFSKPEIKAPKIDVDVSLPKVDVTLPTCDVSLQEADLKAPAVVGGVSISAPGVKIPTTEGSIQLKSPGTEAIAPSAGIAVEGAEGKVAGLEGKIKMPKFEKPKFGVTLPKGKVPEGEISLPKMEVQIPKPQVEAQVSTIDLKTPKLEVEIDVPEAETQVSGWKMQMPSVKMPKMPKADIQAPKVDISLPSVDVTLPKAQVEIQSPETTAQVVKIEGEVKPTEKDAKEKESMFSMPKFGIPFFGWSTTKETSGGVAEVEVSLKEPHVTMPSVKAEGGITVSGPEIKSPSVELEIGSSAGKDGEKGKIKMPDVKLPSVKLPKVKAPQVQVSLPKVEGDIALPKAEIKEGGFEVKSPDMESGVEVETGKGEAIGMKIHMPKVKMPSMRFSKPEIKAPKIDVDVSLPKVDVTLPTCDVSLQEADLKAPAVVGGVSISAPGVKIPTTEGSIQLKSPAIDVVAPSAEIAVEGTEGKAAGLEGKIKVPKFEKPKFGVTLPKGKVPEGEISLPKMEAHIPKPQVEAQVSAIDLKTPKLEVEIDVPEAETQVSGWKMQMPSVKMHKMPKADIQAPKVDISLPSVDVTLPKAQVEIQGPETTAQVVKIEGEIKATEKDAKEKESKFKMPKFGFPSFGWSTTKETSDGVAEIEASLKEPHVTMPSVKAEGGITVSGPEIQAPNVELEIGTSAGKDGEKGKIRMPDVNLPSVKLPKVKAPQVQVSLPKVEGDIALPKSAAEIKEGAFEVKSPDMESGVEVETDKGEATGMKIHMPKVKMPSMRFSKLEIKAPKIDVDVSLSKVDVTLPTCDVSLQEADLKAPAVVGGVSISAPGVKIPTTEGSIQLKSAGIETIAPSAGIAVEGTEGKAASLEGKFKMSKFEKPKFGVTLPKGKVPEGEISLPKMEAHIPKPQVEAQVSAIDLKTPKLEVEIDVPEAETQVSGWKMQMPSVKMPKMPKADIQAPKVDISLPSVDVTLPKAQVEIQGPETTAQVVKIEGEIKATEKVAKEKESMFSMSKFGIPSFGWSTTKETSGGVAEVEVSLKEPQVTTPSVRAEGGITVSGPEIQTPSVELEIGTSAGKDGEKGKIKMPDVKLPSVKLPKVKAPQVQVSLPKVEGDIAPPKFAAEIKECGFEVKSPDMESGIEVEKGKAEATGMKIHMPKVKIPSMRFSKPEIKAHKIDVDVSLPKVDVTLPTCDVSLQEADLKAPAVVGGVSISAPGVKIPTTEGSIQLKSPGTEAIAPSAGIAVEGAEGKVAGLEGKIKMPKFEKPKFGVTLPKGKVPEGEISLPKMEVQIPKAQVEAQVSTIDLKTPKLEVEIDVPEAETQVSGWKMQMPSVKMPKMPKADIQAPKVDISLPSVDVTLPKAQVEIQSPETTAQVVKIEGEVKPTEKDAKEKESMFSMPKFGIPFFGWSTTKETSGGVAEVEVSLKEPHVTMPSVKAEGGITVSGPEIQSPSVELEIGSSAGKDGEKGKIKMPDVKLPSVKLPKVKAPQVQVSLPKVEGDIALPKSAAEIKDGAFEVKSPDMESGVEVETDKGEATGMKIHMPKVKMPSMRFSKPEIKAPKIDVDVSLSKVDVTLPTCDVSLQEADLKAPAVVGGVSISAPGVKIPTTEGSIQLKSPGIEAIAPSAEIAVEEAEGKVAGLEGKIKMSKFEKPKFGVTLPKGKVPEGEVSLPKMEAHIPKPQVETQVAAIDLKTPKLEVEIDVPEAETQVSGWKMQMPSVKMPKIPKADIQAPKMDISLPSVDVTLPKAQVEIQGPETTAPVVKIEGKIKATEKDVKEKESKFKMPKFGFPSFGWSTTKETSDGVAEIEASLKEPHVTMPSVKAEGGITMSGPEIQAPNVELEIGTSAGKDGEKGKIRMPDVKLPSVKLPKVKAPQVQVSLPKVEGDIALPKSAAEIKEGAFEVKSPDMESGVEVETGKGEATGMKIHMPKVKMPSMRFSKPEIKAPKIDVDVSLSKVDVTLPTCDVSLQEADLKAPAVVGGVSISAPGVKIPTTEGSIQLKSAGIETIAPSAGIAVEGTEGKAASLEGKIKMSKFEKPKFGVTLPKGKVPEGEISLPKMEAHIPKPQVEAEVATIDLKTPKLEVEVEVPEAETKVSGWKMQMPSVKMPKADIQAPKVDISLPSVDVTLPRAQVEIQGPETTAQVVKTEGEVKATEKDTKEKESKFKMPKFGFPSFGWSTTKEISGVVAEVEASLKEPHMTMPSVKAEGGITVSGPEIQAPSVELEIGTSAGKDGEKSKIKKPQFSMPKISLPKMKGHKAQVSLPKLESDVSSLKSENEDVSVKISGKGSSGDGEGIPKKMPKDKISTLEFSKPEIKIPKMDVDVSLPKVDVTLPTYDVNIQQADRKLRSAGAQVSLSAPDIKIPRSEGSTELKSPEIGVEVPPAGITVDGIEVKVEDLEGKIKMPKFQKPKFGISLPKGKVPESEVSLPKMEADFPQLKMTTDIADIAVEAQKAEDESGISSAETESTGWKIKMPKIPEADTKAPKVDINLPSVHVSVPMAETGIQDSNMVSNTGKTEGEIKPVDTEAEGKEGHFKLPKFKLPSFSWSPKKEASIKADFEVSLEEPKMTVSSGKIDTKVAEIVTEDQGPSMDLDVEISTGKEEQKSQIKKPQFIMPKISFSKIKTPKSHVNLPKVEADITVPKTERDGEDLVQIPDIESSHIKNIEEGAQISIKMPKVKIPTLEFSKPESKVPQAGMDITLPKVDSTLPTCDVSFQQADLKSGLAGDDVILSTGIKFPTEEASIELKSPETGVERPLAVNEIEVKVEGLEGKIKMPKLQKPKFGISLPKGKRPENEIRLPKMEVGAPHLTMKSDIADTAVESPMLEVKSDVSDVGIEVSAGKMKMPQVSITDIKAPEMDVSLPSVSVSIAEVAIQSPEVEDMKVQGEYEMKSGEIQSEEHQSWFKMPKFRMPTFGRSSSKEKRGDSDSEGSLEKSQIRVPSVQIQTVIDAPEYATSLPGVDTEPAAGKDILKGKIKSAKAEIPKVGVSLHKGKSSDVTLSKFEADVSLPPETAVIKVNIPETETYADVVKRNAEGQKLQTHIPKALMPKAELSASEISASKTSVDISLPRVDITLPKCDLALQEQKAKSECAEVPTAEHSIELKSPEIGAKASSVEIVLDGTQKKLDVLLPKVELDIQHPDAGVKTEKLGGVIKSTGKDVQGTESKLKMPKFSVPSFGWSATKGTGDVADVKTNLEDPKLGASGIKMDAEISVADHEIEFQAESVEKDISAGVGVKVEDGDEASKMKTSKFKMPKFGMLHSKAKGSEVDVFLPKLEADVSLPKTELSIVEIQLQKADGSIDLKSPDSDLMESSIRISKDKPEKHSESIEANIKIPKLKIPAFAYSAPTVETDVSTSRMATAEKVAGTDTEASKLEVSTKIHKEKSESAGDNIQMPTAKIPTLAEPDIKTLKVDIKLPSTDSSISKAALQTQGSLAEGKDIKTQGEVERGHVDIERHETYSSQIVKESEIPSSEIKTATFGFSLLKAKILESHVKLDIPVQLQSYTEYKSEVSEREVHQPKLSDESTGVAMQKTDTAEFKFSGKSQRETDESDEVVFSSVSLPKLKTLTVEVQSSSKLGDSQSDKQPEAITVSPLSKDDEIAKIPEDEIDMKDQKEKPDSKRPSGRFKFWLPSIGFSSSVDDTGSDSKPEVQKSVLEETQPVDSSESDTDSSKQTEKTGWFRFPRLGFSSPSKKAKSVDKEEQTNQKETKTADEESPSEKPETFFDAEESLSPKEETMKGEENETRGTSSKVQVSGAIVTSSARTELILLERERASQQSIPEDTNK